MKKTKMVVFDIAGTTVKDRGNIALSFMEAFQEKDISVTVSDVNAVMGWRKIDAIKKLLEQYLPDEKDRHPELMESIHDRFTSKMVDFYKTDPELVPLPGAESLFAALQEMGICVCLNTGFTLVITQTILDRLGWKKGERIDDFICSDQVAEGRPHAFMIRELMLRNGIATPEEVVKVGDTEVDILEGRAAHCGKVIAVTTGAYTQDQLQTYRPDAIINSLSELLPLLP